MKKLFTISTLAVTILSFVACNSNQTADLSLKDDTQRTKIISTLVKDPTYSKEMMDVMMNDENCKNMMSQHMMSMCKSDSSMCKMMMGRTMEMCEGDESMCKMMTNSMKSHTGVMKSVKTCCDMDKMMDKKDAHMNHNQK